MTLSTPVSSVSPGTIISVLAVFLYCVGFVRIELNLHEQNSRIEVLEMKRTSEGHLRHKQAGKGGESEIKYKPDLIRPVRTRRDKSSFDNSTESIHTLQEQLLKKIKAFTDKSIQRCAIRAQSCVRGPPGRPGSKGDKGARGRRGPKGKTGRRAAVGPRGPPGRTGKQGIMGPAGIKGENGGMGPQGLVGLPGVKGAKGEVGPQGMPGLKGDPGQSISSPNVVISPPSQTANESSAAILHCSVTGNPKPVILWRKVNGVLPKNRYEVSPSGRLKLNQVRLGDAGEYQCEARNILGVSQAKSSLVVHVSPRISLKPGPIHSEGGKIASLPKCDVTGNPPPKVTWSKVLGQLPVGRSVVNNGQLSLRSAQKSDSGLYTCHASNLLGTQAAHTQLVVVFPPQFVLRPPSVLNAVVGQTLQINCSAQGDPRPTVTWKRAGGHLPAGRAEVLNGSLILRRVTAKDSGTYICTARSVSILNAPEAAVNITTKRPCPSLGAASGGRLPDSSFTASSIAGNPFAAKHGRLNHSQRAWCKASNSISPNNYLQVDLGAVYRMCAVATQGSDGDGVWTTRYKLAVSTDGVSWNTYQENGSDKEFNGNTDENSVVKNFLPKAISLRLIRFVPTARKAHPCLRVDVYGWN